MTHSEIDGNTSLNGGGISSGNQGSPNGTAQLRVSHSGGLEHGHGRARAEKALRSPQTGSRTAVAP